MSLIEEFSLRSDGREGLLNSVKVLLTDHSGVESWSKTKCGQLALYWSEKGKNALPAPLKEAEQITDFIWNWLKYTEPTEESDPYADGEEKGYKIYLPSYEEKDALVGIEDFYLFAIIKCVWIEYSK